MKTGGPVTKPTIEIYTIRARSEPKYLFSVKDLGIDIPKQAKQFQTLVGTACLYLYEERKESAIKPRP